MIPPAVLRIRVVEHGKKQVGLWLPLVLVWPLLLLLALVIAPLVIIAAVLLWPSGRGKAILLSGPSLYALLCSLRGLTVQVEGIDEQVLIAIR